MAPTPLNRPATVTGDTSALAGATSLEKNTVLERLLVTHPELIEGVENLVKKGSPFVFAGRRCGC